MSPPLSSPIINFYRTQLRVSLGETSATDGNVGGYMAQTDLVAALTTIPALMAFRDAAGPLIQGFVDLATGQPEASCDSPRGGIGVGLGFAALRAVIAPTSVSGTLPGTCGSAPPPDAGTFPRDVGRD